MNEEKINQIIKNQQAIMMGLRELDEISIETSNSFLMEELGNTNMILNPEVEPTLPEKTNDVLNVKEVVE